MRNDCQNPKPNWYYPLTLRDHALIDSVEFWVLQLSKVTEKLGLFRGISSMIGKNSKPKQERTQTHSAQRREAFSYLKECSYGKDLLCAGSSREEKKSMGKKTDRDFSSLKDFPTNRSVTRIGYPESSASFCEWQTAAQQRCFRRNLKTD